MRFSSFVSSVFILCCLVPVDAVSDDTLPVVFVRGDEEAMLTVKKLLEDRGIRTTEIESRCTVMIQLEPSSDGIILTLSDQNGPTERRKTGSYLSAANTIDAWVKDGLHTPTFETPPHSQPPSGAVPSPEPVAAVSLAVILGSAFDGGILFGGKLAGAFFVGPVVVGPTVALHAEPALTGMTKSQNTIRTILDLTLGVDYPFSWHGWTLRPGLDIGGSVVSSRRSEQVSLSATEEEEEEDEEDSLSVDVSWQSAYREWELAVGAHFILLRPIGRGFLFALGLHATVYPTADTSQRVDESVGISIAGQPLGAAYVALGLEFGI